MKSIFTFIISFLFIWSFTEIVYAQDSATKNNSQITVSMLTCGIGADLYASFGHSGIRIQDASKGTDEVYNYGTFDFSDPNFYKKFVLGKLDYFLSKSTYKDFVSEYKAGNRSVKEQILNLDSTQKINTILFLEQNLKPENKYYKYDFIYDNCATRIRDAFSHSTAGSIVYGNILRDNKVTYRQALNSYIRNNHWSRLGINLLFGRTVDSVMTDETSMFLPDYLYEGMKGAQIDAKNIVVKQNELVKGAASSVRAFNGPFWLSIGILLLTFLSYHVPTFRKIKPLMNFLVLTVSGLLGMFMLFMWIGTAHHSCSENYNILWALPTNIIVAYFIFRRRKWFKFYSLIGITLVIVAMIVHILGIQELPMMEIVPFLGALMYVYLDLYKKALSAIVQDPSNHQKLHQ